MSRKVPTYLIISLAILCLAVGLFYARKHFQPSQQNAPQLDMPCLSYDPSTPGEVVTHQTECYRFDDADLFSAFLESTDNFSEMWMRKDPTQITDQDRDIFKRFETVEFAQKVLDNPRAEVSRQRFATTFLMKLPKDKRFPALLPYLDIPEFPIEVFAPGLTYGYFNPNLEQEFSSLSDEQEALAWQSLCGGFCADEEGLLTLVRVAANSRSEKVWQAAMQCLNEAPGLPDQLFDKRYLSQFRKQRQIDLGKIFRDH